jgi:hypothetical protein
MSEIVQLVIVSATLAVNERLLLSASVRLHIVASVPWSLCERAGKEVVISLIATVVFNMDVGLASLAENLEWEMFDIRLYLCIIVLT